MEKTKKETKDKINWSLWLSVVAIILSIFSFFISEGTLQFDKVNFIIGVLAILVTFLLGWQIYNAVGVKRELEKFEEKINGYKTEINTIIDKKVTESEKKIEKIEIDLKTEGKATKSYIDEEFRKNLFEYYFDLASSSDSSKDTFKFFINALSAINRATLNSASEKKCYLLLLKLIKNHLVNTVALEEQLTFKDRENVLKHIDIVLINKNPEELISLKGILEQ